MPIASGMDLNPAQMTRSQLLELVSELDTRLAAAERENRLLKTECYEGFWEWFIEDEQEYLSPSFWEALGREPREHRHRLAWRRELVHPDDVNALDARFLEYVRSQGRVPYDLLTRYRHADGHWVTMRCQGRVVQWNDAELPVRLVGTQTDQTDLVETRTRAEIIYLGSSVGIWDWLDVSGDKEYWTPRFYSLLGYEFEEIEPSLASFQKLLHPDDVARTFAAVEAHFAGRAPFDLEYRLRCKSGEYRWFHGVGELVLDPAGEPSRMVGSIQDIHDRKVAERELEAMNLRHRISLKASNIGVWDWDMHEDRLVWDAQMFKLYGLERRDIDPSYSVWAAAVHRDDRDKIERRLRQAIERGEDFDAEFRVVWPNAEVRHLHSSAATVCDDEGKVIRMIGVNWDVTEYKRTCEALQRRNEDLSQFAYRTSHDLKSPLVTMRGLLKMMGEDLAAGDYQEVADNVIRCERQSGKLETLVNDVLSLARAELGTTDFRSVEDVQQFVEAAVRIDTPDLDEVEIRVTVEGCFDEPIPDLRLRNILGNLVSNGVKYRDPAKSSSFVAVTMCDLGERMKIRVVDNGRGVPEEFQSVLFGLFKRFHPDVAEGSGLGLSIVKRHVERLNGQISCASSRAGTSFEIVIPYREANR